MESESSKMVKETISDKIKIKDIKGWGNDIITISAPTGSGKSYFVKNVLYEFAKERNKKILFLIHRANCVRQFQMEIERDNKTDIIDIKTYQSLEAINNNYKSSFNFTPYQYIVCDEFHYFMGDAQFNYLTDISLDMILEQNDKTRIFMSATGEYMKLYINNIAKKETIDYKLPIKFDYIKQLRFFNKDETMETYINELIEEKEKEKCIFFIQSAQKAYDLYDKYKKYCLFNCGKSDKHYRYVDEIKINNMLKNEKFDEHILITTTCLDAGVNLIDNDLKHIVIDVEDIGSLRQCIGRKRIQTEDDKIYLYIKNITNKQFGGKITQFHKRIEMAEYLNKHNTKEYVNKYGRTIDYTHITYDAEVAGETDVCIKKVNKPMYFKCKFDLANIESMLMKYGKYAYCMYLADLFGFRNEHGFDYEIEEEQYECNKLQNYLNSMMNKRMLQVKDRKELIEKINVKSNGKLLRSLNNLNGALEERNIPFRIIEFSTSEMINGKKRRYPNTWEVKKIN